MKGRQYLNLGFDSDWEELGLSFDSPDAFNPLRIPHQHLQTLQRISLPLNSLERTLYLFELFWQVLVAHAPRLQVVEITVEEDELEQWSHLAPDVTQTMSRFPHPRVHTLIFHATQDQGQEIRMHAMLNTNLRPKNVSHKVCPRPHSLHTLVLYFPIHIDPEAFHGGGTHWRYVVQWLQGLTQRSPLFMLALCPQARRFTSKLDCEAFLALPEMLSFWDGSWSRYAVLGLSQIMHAPVVNALDYHCQRALIQHGRPLQSRLRGLFFAFYNDVDAGQSPMELSVRLINSQLFPCLAICRKIHVESPSTLILDPSFAMFAMVCSLFDEESMPAEQQTWCEQQLQSVFLHRLQQAREKARCLVWWRQMCLATLWHRTLAHHSLRDALFDWLSVFVSMSDDEPIVPGITFVTDDLKTLPETEPLTPIVHVACVPSHLVLRTELPCGDIMPITNDKLYTRAMLQSCINTHYVRDYLCK